jgi:hypothetical protein
MGNNETPTKGNIMLKDKFRAVVNHPAAGLVTVLVINTGIVVAAAVAAKKLDKSIKEETEA